MPVHDWTRVDAGIFHAFHVAWIPRISEALNGGLLPPGYYSLPEQHAGRAIADIVTLHASAPPTSTPLPWPPDTGGVAVAAAGTQMTRLAAGMRRQTIDLAALSMRRTLAIRHVSGHRLVALIEVVSPANKDRVSHLEEFAGKVASALSLGIHVLVIDLFPPGIHDPDGIHSVICRELDPSGERYASPGDAPLTLASYGAGSCIEIYLQHIAPGAALPEMPIFLRPDRFVNVPLESTYRDAFHGLPAYWRDVLERADE